MYRRLPLSRLVFGASHESSRLASQRPRTSSTPKSENLWKLQLDCAVNVVAGLRDEEEKK